MDKLDKTLIGYKAIYILPSLNLWEFDSMIPLDKINSILEKGNLLYFYTEDLKTNKTDYIGMLDEILFNTILFLNIDIKNYVTKIIPKITHREILGFEI